MYRRVETRKKELADEKNETRRIIRNKFSVIRQTKLLAIRYLSLRFDRNHECWIRNDAIEARTALRSERYEKLVLKIRAIAKRKGDTVRDWLRVIDSWKRWGIEARDRTFHTSPHPPLDEFVSVTHEWPAWLAKLGVGVMTLLSSFLFYQFPIITHRNGGVSSFLLRRFNAWFASVEKITPTYYNRYCDNGRNYRLKIYNFSGNDTRGERRK